MMSNKNAIWCRLADQLGRFVSDMETQLPSDQLQARLANIEGAEQFVKMPIREFRNVHMILKDREKPTPDRTPD